MKRIVIALSLAAPLLVAATNGEPAAPQLRFVLSELVTLAPDVTPGTTPYGGRNIVPITGGTFAGPDIRGTILPGGWDWQLHRLDGCLDIKADYFLKTDDGVVINIVNAGTLCPPGSGTVPKPGYTQPRFEAPTGRYDWLNKGAFIGTLLPAKAPDGGPAVRIGVYQAE